MPSLPAVFEEKKMKRSLSVAVMACLLVSACVPSFAQRAKSDDADLVKPLRTAFARVEAYTEGVGALVRWYMTVERQNLGFNVYRVTTDGTELVNPTVILSSSGRAAEEPKYGEMYQVFDPEGGIGSRYFVRTIGRDGRNLVSRTSSASLVKDMAATTGQTTDEWLAASNSPNRKPDAFEMNMEPELRGLVQDSLQAPDLTTHRWVVSQPGVKIGVRREGLYRVTAGELAAAGWDTEGDSSTWRLFTEGNEQAITVGSGNGYIEFYGRPIDTVESDTRVYYLISGTVPGKRMRTKVMRPVGGSSINPSYAVTSVRKERTSHDNTIMNGDLENYWGRVLTSDPTTFPFTLVGPTSDGMVNVQVKLQGYSPNTHLVRLVLNGTELQSPTWFGYDAFTANLTVPASLLIDGTNNLEMKTLNPGDFSLFDSISLKHNRRYVAEQGRINFFTPNYRKVDLSGFPSSNIRVFETTYDGDPIEIVGLPIQQDGATFTVKMPSHRNIVGFGVDSSGVLAAPMIVPNSPSSLTTNTEPSDLVIITHSAADFKASSETWADYRRGQGYTATVIDVADIFDEFSYGSTSSAAVKSFLNYAYTTWHDPPRYVLLMGDASYDPRNYEGFGYWDLVPTKNVSLIFEETGSDDALVDFNNDGLAEIAIGRISARTALSIGTALNKTMVFENTANQTLDRGAVFAYDLPSGFDFEGMSQQLRNELPPTVPSVMVYRGDANSGTTLLNELNTGRFIANYSGHGSIGLWASSSFFANSTVPSLTNINKPTVFTMLTCLNGYFLHPSSSFDSLAENLVKAPNGGGPATWSSTARTTPDLQLLMGQRFYNKLGEGTIPRLGDLIKDAKTAIPTGGDVRYSWILLGDPLLRVR